jgi:hypothetical protein
MQTSGVEAVPNSGRELLLLFTIPGAVLGWLVWWFGHQIGFRLFDTPVLTAAVMAVLLGSTAYSLTVYRGRWWAAVLLGALTGLVLGGLFFVGMREELNSEEGVLLLGFLSFGTLAVLIPYLKAFTGGGGLGDYRRLYGEAWNNPAIVGIAGAFMGVGYGLAWLIAALFDFIGLPFLTDLLNSGWFNAVIIGALLGTGVCIIRQRDHAVLAFRGISFALIRTLSPIFAVATAIFLAGVMVRGFGSIIEGLSPVVTLTTTAAIAIVMINAVVADEGNPTGALPTAAARALGLMLVFLVALAGYGLWLRIDAEGLTPDRIAAVVVVGVLAAYAPLYAVSALSGQWNMLRMGNIALSLAVVALAVFLQTPFFKPLTWSAQSQAEKLLAAPGEAEADDLWYLRYKLGAAGELAYDRVIDESPRLKELSAKISEPTEARSVPPKPSWATTDGYDAAMAAGRLRVHPRAEAMPQDWRPRLDRKVDREPGAIVFVVVDTGVWSASETPGGVLIEWHPMDRHRGQYGPSSRISLGETEALTLLDRLAENGMPIVVRQVDVPALEGLDPEDFRPAWQLLPEGASLEEQP